MSISATDIKVPEAVTVRLSDDTLTLDLSDGRSISVPLAWYPRLLHANEAERGKWRLIGRGAGIHWPDLDEDISVESIIAGRASNETQASLKRWLGARAG